MAKIYNRNFRDVPADAFYVGRPTIYGNPFTHRPLKDTLAIHKVSSVEEAIDEYAKYLREQFPELKSEAASEFFAPLVGKDLICWCAPDGGIEHTAHPLVCHAQILASYAEAYSIMTHNP